MKDLWLFWKVWDCKVLILLFYLGLKAIDLAPVP